MMPSRMRASSFIPRFFDRCLSASIELLMENPSNDILKLFCHVFKVVAF